VSGIGAIRIAITAPESPGKSLGKLPQEKALFFDESVLQHGLHGGDGLALNIGWGHLPDLLMALASCARRGDFSQSCGARFTDLVARSPAGKRCEPQASSAQNVNGNLTPHIEGDCLGSSLRREA
jgi:hypothetical protein